MSLNSSYSGKLFQAEVVEKIETQIVFNFLLSPTAPHPKSCLLLDEVKKCGTVG